MTVEFADGETYPFSRYRENLWHPEKTRKVSGAFGKRDPGHTKTRELRTCLEKYYINRDLSLELELRLVHTYDATENAKGRKFTHRRQMHWNTHAQLSIPRWRTRSTLEAWNEYFLPCVCVQSRPQSSSPLRIRALGNPDTRCLLTGFRKEQRQASLIGAFMLARAENRRRKVQKANCWL